MERLTQQAIINDKLIEFDFIKGDLIKTKGDNVQGVITEVDNPFVNVEWVNEEVRKRRGTRWMVDSVERVN